VLALVALHALWSLAPALREPANDFANYYVPARMLLEGRSLDRVYERTAFQAEVGRAGIPSLASFVPHPPANALLLLPLAALGPLAAKVAWVFLLISALLGAYLLLRAQLDISPWLLALCFLLLTSSLRNALVYGQPYPLLLLFMCASLRAAAASRFALAGALLAPVVALKLYGLPFLVRFVLARRFRAAAGVLAGLAAISAVSVALVGREAHRTYLREVLPRSLVGEIQDPYSTVWGSFASLSQRLFQAEPDLNPDPLLDAPALARAAGAAASALLLWLAVLARSRQSGDAALRREWAILTLASLAAAPLTGSYHFVLLALPVALLLAEEGSLTRKVLLLGLLAFAASPLPHYFAGFAHGAWNVLAYPRLAAVVMLLLVALRGCVTRRQWIAASFAAACVFAVRAALPAGFNSVWTELDRPDAEAAWARVGDARGYLAAEPVACDGGFAWMAVEGDRFVVRRSDGRVLRAEGHLADPRCENAVLRARVLPGAARSSLVSPWSLVEADADGDAALRVEADGRSLIVRRAGAPARVLVSVGSARRPRLSPDRRFVAYECWIDGSWDVCVVGREDGRLRRLTDAPSNELEPAWLPDGEAVVFASDDRRGVGSTALYTVAFRP
jgi:hypothetical protein